MQKLVLLALLFTLAMVCAKRPNYSRQGRTKTAACRLSCVWDSVSCGIPCRMIFRAHRSGFLKCTSVCNKERITCFKSCDPNPLTAPPPQTAAGAGKTVTATAAEPKATETEPAQEEEVDGEETGDSNESVED